MASYQDDASGRCLYCGAVLPSPHRIRFTRPSGAAEVANGGSDGDLRLPNGDLNSLLSTIQRSKLVPEEQFAQLQLRASDFLRKARTTDFGDFVLSLITDAILTRWQVDRLLEGRYKGFFLDNYKLLWSLSSGSVAAVYVAENVRTTRQCAIKVLSPKYAVRPDGADVFFSRVKELGHINHPGLVTLIDANHSSSAIYCVHDLVVGQDLFSLVKPPDRLSLHTIGQIMARLASAIAYVHRRGNHLCNLAPSNIIIDAHGDPTIVVPGVSFFLIRDGVVSADDLRDLELSAFVPINSNVDRTDYWRLDICSMGRLLQFLLTSEIPLTGPSASADVVVHAIRHVRPDAPASFVEICGATTGDVCRTGYPTASAIAATFQSWLQETAGTE